MFNVTFEQCLLPEIVEINKKKKNHKQIIVKPIYFLFHSKWKIVISNRFEIPSNMIVIEL